MKTKKEIVTGQKYRGYGMLNEYGEWFFIPEDTGSRSGQRKMLTQGENHTVYTTQKKLLVHLSIDKSEDKQEMLRNLFRIVNNLIKILSDYEF